MSDFVVIKNLKAPLADVSITDGVPEENVDYSLMVDVALYEERVKKGTGEDEADKTFIFEATGPIRLINMQKVNERITAHEARIGDIGDSPLYTDGTIAPALAV